MRGLVLTRVIFLALLLAVSHVAMASHYASHAGADTAQCDLCFSHAKSGSAIINSDTFPGTGEVYGVVPNHVPACRLCRSSLTPYQSRAPPAISE